MALNRLIVAGLSPQAWEAIPCDPLRGFDCSVVHGPIPVHRILSGGVIAGTIPPLHPFQTVGSHRWQHNVVVRTGSDAPSRVRYKFRWKLAIAPTLRLPIPARTDTG